MDRFTDYTKETQEYLKAIEETLLKKYGSVKDEWYTLLEMLGGQVDLYKTARMMIKENGLTTTSARGLIVPNPAIKIQNDALIQINKLVGEFGISPKASAKVKITSEDADEKYTNEENDFIANLMK